MRPLWTLSVLLSGCVAHGAGVRAPSNALACAELTASGLGYQVVHRSAEAGDGSFIAEGSVIGDDATPALGVISARVWREDGGTRLQVTGTRYRERRSNAPTLGPTLRPAALGPTDVRVGAAPRGRYRLSPGVVGEDARMIREQCGGATGSNVALHP